MDGTEKAYQKYIQRNILGCFKWKMYDLKNGKFSLDVKKFSGADP